MYNMTWLVWWVVETLDTCYTSISSRLMFIIEAPEAPLTFTSLAVDLYESVSRDDNCTHRNTHCALSKISFIITWNAGFLWSQIWFNILMWPWYMSRKALVENSIDWWNPVCHSWMAAYSYMIYQHHYKVNGITYCHGHQCYHQNVDLTHFGPIIVLVPWELTMIYFSIACSHSQNDGIGTYLMKQWKNDPIPPVKYKSQITVMIHVFQ